MPRLRRETPSRRRRQARSCTARPPAAPASRSPGRLVSQEPPRRQAWAGKTPQQVLAMYPPGKQPASQVLEVMIELFNSLHTALEKTVSHKTRYERASFLRRFFQELQTEAGFKIAPDPRNLGQRHVHAMVQVWRRKQLAPGTIQTYLSFLRGMAMWLGKPGFIREPAFYGLQRAEYERHENAQRDKSWSGNGIDVEAILTAVSAYDVRAGTCMRLMVTLGLRRKESVMCRPHAHVHPFHETGLPEERRNAEHYLWVKGKGGRVRWVPLASEDERAVIEAARQLAVGHDAHMGDPARDLRANLRRLDYVLQKFGLTKRAAGTTGHGARHQRLQVQFEEVAGVPAPVRGGSGSIDPAVDRAARLAVSHLAGHARVRAAAAYCGGARVPGPAKPAAAVPPG